MPPATMAPRIAATTGIKKSSRRSIADVAIVRRTLPSGFVGK